MTADWLRNFRADVVSVAHHNVGYGETTANNRGIFITAIGGKQGMEWCALFAGHCYRRAYQMAKMDEPAWLYRRPGVAEPGAARLFNGMTENGGVRFYDPDMVLPGDLILWKRKGGHHIAICARQDEGIVSTLEGNVGRYPARVKPLAHDVTKEPHFVAFAGLR